MRFAVLSVLLFAGSSSAQLPPFCPQSCITTIPNEPIDRWHRDGDLDGDGIPNHSDPDRDGDGMPNHKDPTPNGGNWLPRIGWPTLAQYTVGSWPLGSGLVLVVDGVEVQHQFGQSYTGVDPYGVSECLFVDPNAGASEPQFLARVNCTLAPEYEPNHPNSDRDFDWIPNKDDEDDDGDGCPDVNDPDHPSFDPFHGGSDLDCDGIPNDSDPDDDGDGCPAYNPQGGPCDADDKDKDRKNPAPNVVSCPCDELDPPPGGGGGTGGGGTGGGGTGGGGTGGGGTGGGGGSGGGTLPPPGNDLPPAPPGTEECPCAQLLQAIRLNVFDVRVEVNQFREVLIPRVADMQLKLSGIQGDVINIRGNVESIREESSTMRGYLFQILQLLREDPPASPSGSMSGSIGIARGVVSGGVEHATAQFSRPPLPDVEGRAPIVQFPINFPMLGIGAFTVTLDPTPFAPALPLIHTFSSIMALFAASWIVFTFGFRP